LQEFTLLRGNPLTWRNQENIPLVIKLCRQIATQFALKEPGNPRRAANGDIPINKTIRLSTSNDPIDPTVDCIPCDDNALQSIATVSKKLNPIVRRRYIYTVSRNRSPAY